MADPAELETLLNTDNMATSVMLVNTSFDVRRLK
jgi:hypothetical protein